MSAYVARTGGGLAEFSTVVDVPKALWSSDLAFLVMNAKAEVGFINAKALESLGLPADQFDAAMGVTAASASGKLAGFELPHVMNGAKKYEKVV